VLAAWTYGNPELESEPLQRELGRFSAEVVGPYWPENRRHVEADYRTLAFPFPELEPPSFAVQQQWTLRQLLGYAGTWSATQQFREVAGRDPLPDLERELARHWGPGPTQRVRWPIAMRVGHKPVTGKDA